MITARRRRRKIPSFSPWTTQTNRYFPLIRSSGADYVKIQNMLSGHGARVEDVKLAYDILGRNVGIKIDGGIKTLQQAETLLAAGATRLGLTATAKIAEEARK